MKHARQEVSPVMAQLSRYVAGALRRTPPASVRERAKLHLVDTFAAMVSGSRLLPGRAAIAYTRSLGGTAEAGIRTVMIQVFTP